MFHLKTLVVLRSEQYLFNNNNYYKYTTKCALVIWHANCIFPANIICYLWLVWLFRILSLCVINGKILGKKVIEHKVFFDFPYNFVWNIYMSSFRYPLFVSDIEETWIASTNFRKIMKYQISWKSLQWYSSCSIRTDRQTDRQTDKMKLIVAFRIFSKAPKN